MSEQLLKYVCESDALSGVRRAFDLMGVAEEEIATAKRRYPRAKKRLHAAFGILCPTGELGRVSDVVYRAHVRELLDRVRRGQDTRDATSAEILVAMSRVSLAAPPGAAFAVAMDRRFEKVFGRRVDGEPSREPYPGAADEVDATFRRKLRSEDRVAK